MVALFAQCTKFVCHVTAPPRSFLSCLLISICYFQYLRGHVSKATIRSFIPLHTDSQNQLQNRTVATRTASWSFRPTVRLYGFNRIASCADDFNIPVSYDNFLNYFCGNPSDRAPFSFNVSSERAHTCCRFLFDIEDIVLNLSLLDILLISKKTKH